MVLSKEGNYPHYCLTKKMTLGRTKLNFATSCKYLGHVICNDLSDEANIQAKVTLIYAKSYNMLRQKIHYCSSVVKKQVIHSLLQ